MRMRHQVALVAVATVALVAVALVAVALVGLRTALVLAKCTLVLVVVGVMALLPKITRQ